MDRQQVLHESGSTMTSAIPPEVQTTALAVPRPAGGRPLQAYLASPNGPGPHPGVVVIHEIFGLNDNIRDIARRFAAEGYAALAVDLFTSRSRAVCMARFMRQMMLNP